MNFLRIMLKLNNEAYVEPYNNSKSRFIFYWDTSRYYEPVATL